jgi:hypothetical protein
VSSATKEPVEVRVIAEDGSVQVGPSLAGKSVRVEVWHDGVFLRFVDGIPEGEAWWLKDPEKLRRALAWAEERSPIESAMISAAADAPVTGKIKKPRDPTKKRGKKRKKKR